MWLFTNLHGVNKEEMFQNIITGMDKVKSP